MSIIVVAQICSQNIIKHIANSLLRHCIVENWTPCAVRGAAAPKEKSDLHQIGGKYRDIYDLLTAHHFFSFFTRPARLRKTLTCSFVHVKSTTKKLIT